MVKSTLIKNKMNKKGQGWSLDLVVAGVIFFSGVVILYIYAINYSSQAQVNLDEMFYEGNLAAELILSEGNYGILVDHKVNQSKLNNFHANYTYLKTLFGVNRHFYFTLKDLELNGNPATYVGRINSSNVDNLIQITRLTIYKNSPTKLQLYVWN